MYGLGNISKPLPYTSNSFKLLATDILLFIHLSITWPIWAGLLSIVLPFHPQPSGALDELACTRENLKDDVVHTVVFIAQILFLISLVILLFMGIPTAVYFGWIGAFIAGNMLFCKWFLNGPPTQRFFAGKKFAKDADDAAGEDWVSNDPAHKGEKWVFINGVAVGQNWMHSNLERLSKTFRRPILGVHNPSFGIPFDVLECILQRTFAYPTLDIRNAYTTLSALLADDDITKLVLIAHSQGAIEAGMVLDWLYATLPSKYVKKLEVFTFGNAANHWNCPIDEQGLLIKHVEHYANEGDWVARFGILHFRQSSDETASADPALKDSGREQHFWNPQTPVMVNAKSDVRKQSTFELEGKRAGMHRFVGRLFKRAGSGHQMNQHYLDNIFVMDEELTKVVDSDDVTTKAREGAESFMNMSVDMELLHRDDTVMPKAQTSSGSRGGQGVRVKELSRLWMYRNGGTPEDWVHHGRKA